MEYFVIGSGPAGVACALGLLNQGVRVTLLDVGERLDPSLRERVDKLADREPHEWLPKELEGLTEQPQMHGGRLAKKTLFGSSFVYAKETQSRFRQTGSQALQSFAKGGLSNIWGASFLPFSAEEMAHWPAKARGLNDHYNALEPLFPMAAAKDGLQKWFPLPSNPLHPMSPSAQSKRLMDSLLTRRDHLEKEGLVFGHSRLAVQTQNSLHRKACRNAGLCLTGCPYFAIFDSATSIDLLSQNPRFTYLPGYRVTRLGEGSSGRVEIEAQKIAASHQTEQFQAAKVYLAAGPLSTLEVVLRSTAHRPLRTQLRYNPYFILPMMTFGATYSRSDPKAHSLSQMFWELKSRSISKYWIHLQVYTYSPVLESELRKRLRFLGPILNPVVEWVLKRLIFVQGYLHSEDALPIEVALRGDQIELNVVSDQGLPRKIRKVARKLLRLAFLLRAFPLLPALHYGSPGEGNHLGGSFPMSDRPKGFSTDALGRLPEFRNVHLVDSSVFPSIPATTLTFSVMANAHRIALQSLEREQEAKGCE